MNHCDGFDFGFGENNDVVGIYGVVHGFFPCDAVFVIGGDV